MLLQQWRFVRYNVCSNSQNRVSCFLYSHFRWPSLRDACQQEMRKGYVHFREVIEARMKCRKELRHFLTQMSKKYYDRDDHVCDPEFLASFRNCFRSTVVFEDEDLDLLIRPDETAQRLNYFINELTSFLQQSQIIYQKDGIYYK